MALIDTAYSKALDVLRANSTAIGFSASTERVSNYYSVWARDHAICSLAVAMSNDKELRKTAVDGVLFLLRKQADHGQIPSYVEIEHRKKVFGGLGSITSIDSNMWMVIAAAELYRRTEDKRLISQTNMLRYAKLYRLLKAFDSNDCGLLEVHIAGDWADVFNRTYHVLYDECLYYQALKDLLFLFHQRSLRTKHSEIKKISLKRVRWISRRKPKVKRRINELFWFTPQNIPKVIEEYMIYDKIESKEYCYYQSHLMPFKHQWSKRFDTFGNLLAILTGIADKKKSENIIKHALDSRVDSPVPVRSLHPPVFRHERDWEPIYARKEQPYTYHNGGSWPMMMGFWVLALTRLGRSSHAKQDLETLAKVLERDNWNFHEHYHGKTGKPLGRTQQAWSAAGYVIAYHALKNRATLF